MAVNIKSIELVNYIDENDHDGGKNNNNRQAPFHLFPRFVFAQTCIQLVQIR